MMIPAILGGIGLFILGMILLTDGLKAMAGNSLRGLLAKATAGPWAAVATGAGATVIAQSSSVTTLATIGFVSAGLLTFHEALGLIVGANLGTTSTGWIVALLGFELDIAVVFMPLIALGMALRLLWKRRFGHLGMAMAGFGVIFVGVDALQDGMKAVAERFDPASFPDASLPGGLLLALIGFGMSVVMQSSSAAMATTLAALASGTIDLHQAAVLSVGANIGTTLKSGLSAIGGSAAVRRTAAAHIGFNTGVGVLTYILLEPLLWVSTRVAMPMESEPGPVTLAAFDTVANVMGVAVFMPLAKWFAAALERIVPDRGEELTRLLDPGLTGDAPMAVDAAKRTTIAAALAAAEAISEFAHEGDERNLESALEKVHPAVEATRSFLANVRTGDVGAGTRYAHLGVLHALDHLDRLVGRAKRPKAAAAAGETETFDDLRELMRELADVAIGWLSNPTSEPPVEDLKRRSRKIAAAHRAHRARILEATAHGNLTPDDAAAQLAGGRWVERQAIHLWRAVLHLAERPERDRRVAAAHGG